MLKNVRLQPKHCHRTKFIFGIKIGKILSKMVVFAVGSLDNAFLDRYVCG